MLQLKSEDYQTVLKKENPTILSLQSMHIKHSEFRKAKSKKAGVKDLPCQHRENKHVHTNQ